MNLLQNIYGKSLIENEKNVIFWEDYLQNLEALDLNNFSKKLAVPILVPIGSRILFRGELKHTNEVTVALGADYFTKCSVNQAEVLKQHRIKDAKSKLEILKKERDYLKNQLSYSNQILQVNPGYDIIEVETDEEDKIWRKQHRENVRQYKQRKDKGNDVPINAISDEELWHRLEELELQEELENELDKWEGNDLNKNEEQVSKEPPNETEMSKDDKHTSKESPKKNESNKGENNAFKESSNKNELKKVKKHASKKSPKENEFNKDEKSACKESHNKNDLNKDKKHTSKKLSNKNKCNKDEKHASKESPKEHEFNKGEKNACNETPNKNDLNKDKKHAPKELPNKNQDNKYEKHVSKESLEENEFNKDEKSACKKSHKKNEMNKDKKHASKKFPNKNQINKDEKHASKESPKEHEFNKEETSDSKESPNEDELTKDKKHACKELPKEHEFIKDENYAFKESPNQNELTKDKKHASKELPNKNELNKDENNASEKTSSGNELNKDEKFASEGSSSRNEFNKDDKDTFDESSSVAKSDNDTDSDDDDYEDCDDEEDEDNNNDDFSDAKVVNEAYLARYANRRKLFQQPPKLHLFEIVVERHNVLKDMVIEMRAKQRRSRRNRTEEDLVERLDDMERLEQLEDEIGMLEDMLASDEDDDIEEGDEDDNADAQQKKIVAFADENDSETFELTFKHSEVEPSKEPYDPQNGITKPSDIYKAYSSSSNGETTSILKKPKSDITLKVSTTKSMTKEKEEEHNDGVNPLPNLNSAIIVGDVVEKVECNDSVHHNERPMSLFKKKRQQLKK